MQRELEYPGRFQPPYSIPGIKAQPVLKSPHQNNFPFYTSRLQAGFARSESARSSKELAITAVLHYPIEQIQSKSGR
jgi:hypothetical protein